MATCDADNGLADSGEGFDAVSNHDFKDDVHDEHMGLMASYRWHHDPKTILFVLARYKFCARMLHGYANVLEVGCADAFGSRIVRQAVGKLTALDIDGQMIEDAKKRTSTKWDILYVLGDMSAVGTSRFDALYCLDVLEHVLPSEEGKFMAMASALAPVAIFGMPSLESQPYASPFSRDNHVNCKSEEGLRELMQPHYEHVFMFGMNDEVVHTGFGPLCHYRFALAVR
jgi:SAM-dependent methyltransferase